jgi:hypothetical protein
MELANFYTYKLSVPTQKALFQKSEALRRANEICKAQQSNNKARKNIVGAVVNRLLPTH